MKKIIVLVAFLAAFVNQSVDSAPAPIYRPAKVTLSHSFVVVGGTTMTGATFDKGDVTFSYYPEGCWSQCTGTWFGQYTIRGTNLYVRIKREGGWDDKYAEYKGGLSGNPRQIIVLELIPEVLTELPTEER
jgi:hypothetical protein